MSVAATAALTLSLIRDIYCSEEVLFETCVAMKFVDDDNDDDVIAAAEVTEGKVYVNTLRKLSKINQSINLRFKI